MLIVNPGSGPPDKDVKNSYERAKTRADRWHSKIVTRWPEVTIKYPDPADVDEGRWTFEYHHPVTGMTRTLETHGVMNKDTGAFGCRIYWNGCSTSEPRDGDWVPHWGEETPYLEKTPHHDRGRHHLDGGSTHQEDVTWKVTVKFERVCICDRVGEDGWLYCAKCKEEKV